MSKSRQRAISARWGDILAMTIVGASTLFLLGPWVHDQGSHAARELGWLGIIPWAVAIGALSVLTLRNQMPRLTAFLGLRHTFSFPPVWVAGFFGAACVVIAWAYGLSAGGAPAIDGEERLCLVWIGGSLFALPLIVAGGPFLLNCGRRVSDTDDPDITGGDHVAVLGASALGTDFEALCNWILNDLPVDDLRQDRFGHQIVARRILGRFLDSSVEAERSVALLGRYGSGKSTIMRLVMGQAAPRRDLKIVPVSLWPYTTAEAAVRGVINALVSAFAEEVNVLPMLGLSRRYAQAIQGLSRASWLTPHLERIEDPVAVLQQLEQLANAIGVRVVVWVEDFERFAGWDEDGAHKEQGSNEASHLGPLRALLHCLDERASFTVVMAATTLGVSFDQEKLARHIERVPDLRYADLGNILRCFRNGCLHMLGDRVDPANAKARAELAFSESQLDDASAYLGFETEPPASIALASLCAAPRILKMALRECHDQWKRLVGEIDFDDLLVLSLVKHTDPEVFALISDYAETPGPSKRADLSRVTDRIYELTGPQRALSLKALVSFLFPAPDQVQRRPQGVSFYDRPYWGRFVDGEVGSDRDQPVLRAIKNFDSEVLVEYLGKSPEREAIKHFGYVFKTDKLERLLRSLILKQLRDSAKTWPGQRQFGLEAMWLIVLKKVRQSGQMPTSFERLVKRLVFVCTRRNLPLAAELVRHFTRTGGQTEIPEIFLSASSLQQAFTDHFAREYTGKPDRLAEVLEHSREGLLARCVWGFSRTRSNDFNGLPFDGWEGFAQTLIEAATRFPDTVLPQVVHLITSAAGLDEDDRTRYALNGELLDRLFPGTLLISLFASHSIREFEDPQTQLRFVAAQTGAKALLRSSL
ncbi:MAG: hypothetical protein SFV15_26615 [Polyangiaceae bacterium]|nr:hypothetical protein [Polyangiaceae bacterium]